MNGPNPRGGRALLRKAGLLARSPYSDPLPRTKNVPVGMVGIAELTVAGPRRSCTGLPEHLPRLCCLPDHYTAKDGNVKWVSLLRRTPNRALLHGGPPLEPRPCLGEGRLGIIRLKFTSSMLPKSPRWEKMTEMGEPFHPTSWRFAASSGPRRNGTSSCCRTTETRACTEKNPSIGTQNPYRRIGSLQARLYSLPISSGVSAVNSRPCFLL